MRVFGYLQCEVETLSATASGRGAQRVRLPAIRVGDLEAIGPQRLHRSLTWPYMARERLFPGLKSEGSIVGVPL